MKFINSSGSPLRIVQLSQECSVNGGVGAYVTRLCDLLGAAGHDVMHIHADTGPHVQASQTVRRWCVPHFDEFDRPAACRARADQVLEILQSVQPDVVHIQGNNNFVLEREIRQRFASVKFLHAYDFCPSGNKFHHLLGRSCQHATGPLCVFRMGYKRCMLSKRPWVIWNHYRRCVEANRNNFEYPRLIVASEYVKDQAIASGYVPDQIEVLPYFVELPVLPAEASAQANTILFAGRVTRVKGLELLLRALARMRSSTRLIVAGDGADLDRSKRLAGRLGLTHRTDFLGWQDARQLSSLYTASSLLAVPSIWPEPFGIVGIEAMSYGKPVVAFQVGGIPEWLDHGITGFTVRPYDVEDMAARMSYLLDYPQIAHAMGLQGRRLVEQKFNPERHVARLTEIFRELMDARNRGAACTG